MKKESFNFTQVHCNKEYQQFSPGIYRVGPEGSHDSFYSLQINNGLSVLLSLPRLIELNSVLSAAVDQYKNDLGEPAQDRGNFEDLMDLILDEGLCDTEAPV